MLSLLIKIITFFVLIFLTHVESFSQVDTNMVFSEPDNKGKSFAKTLEQPHKIGVFVGGVNANYNEKTSLTFGLNYRLKIMELLGSSYNNWNVIGLGMNIENNLHDNNEIAVSAGAILFLSNEFWFYFYPGVRYFSGEMQFNSNKDSFKEKMFWRAGVSYDFFLSGFIISPSVFEDIIDEQSSLTFGIAFLYRF